MVLKNTILEHNLDTYVGIPLQMLVHEPDGDDGRCECETAADKPANLGLQRSDSSIHSSLRSIRDELIYEYTYQLRESV